MIPIGVRTLTAIGLTPIWVGRGSRMRTSVGQPITMAGGHSWPITAGFGFLAAIWNGVRRGFPGEQGAIMSAGRHCLRAVLELFMKDGRLAVAWISSSTSVPNTTILWMLVSSVSRCYAIVFLRGRKT